MDQTTLILTGNPNVGKSVVFQSLTGSYAEVSNYPGTTVDVMTGTFENCTVIDTPGVYGLSAYNEEERVTLDTVQKGDLLLNVVDGTHLERDLFLTLQLLALEKPMIIAVNLMDEAEKLGICIDFARLEAELGVSAIPICATTGQGLDQVRLALKKGGRFGKIPLSRSENETESYRHRRAYIDKLTADCISHVGGQAPLLSRKLGDAFLRPLTALPMLAGLLALVFLFIGVFLSQYVVGFTEGFLMDVCYRNVITGLVSALVSEGTLLSEVLIGDYGVLTMVPIYLLGLILPLICGFHLLMSLLEDSGLLPRIAVLCDKAFSMFGLNGKAVIPMLLGFGCVTMSLISTRILGSRRERLIAACLLCLAVPCSAQFAIILAVAVKLPASLLALYAAVILLVFVVAGAGLDALVPGHSSDLFLALPPLRLPRPGNVSRKTLLKSKQFLMDAGPLFLAGGLLLSLLDVSGMMDLLEQQLSPITVSLLGLPEESASLFITSMIKRDLGAAQLYAMLEAGLLNAPQLVVALTVITLLVPCFASVAILCKEQGKLQAMLIWLGTMAISLMTGAFVSLLVL